MNCPCPSQSSGRYFISGWARTRCQLSKAGLRGQVCQDIYVAAHFAPIGPWVMRGTAFSSARVSMSTGLSFAQLLDDAHGAMRTLVWHKDQKAVSALILAICTEA